MKINTSQTTPSWRSKSLWDRRLETCSSRRKSQSGICVHVVLFTCYCLHLVLFTCSNVCCFYVCGSMECVMELSFSPHQLLFGPVPLSPFSLPPSLLFLPLLLPFSFSPPSFLLLPPPSPLLLPSFFPPSFYLLPSPRAPVWELSEAEDEGIQADLQSMRSKVSENRTSATSTLSEFSTG